MSSNLGLFNWIRDGVRQSVLLGVSDALESIGAPDQSGKLHPALLSVQQANPTASNIEVIEPAQSKRTGVGNRKRLGRSLKDIEPTPKPSAPQS